MSKGSRQSAVGSGENDGRKKLRAHWPPRRVNHVQVGIPAELYSALWIAADAEEWSLQDEIRARLAATDVGGRALALAIEHIEHMAAWIGKRNAGYSFEALGEDIDIIREGLNVLGGQAGGAASDSERGAP